MDRESTLTFCLLTYRSPFRWTAVEERKRSMQGLAAPPSEPGHRRMSSVDTTSSGVSLGSSPQPVKLLNGRVYGARRASEVAELQKQRREAAEPAFVEWGNAKQGGGDERSSFSAGSSSGGREGQLAESDDGSGMEWVKRRRAEREKAKKDQAEKESREREAKEKEAKDGMDTGSGSVPPLSPSLSSASGSGSSEKPVTPGIRIGELPLPPPPLIQVSEPMTPMGGPGEGMVYEAGAHDMEKAETQAIPIAPRGGAAGRDVFDDHSGGEGEDDEEEEEEDDEEEEEEDEEEEDDGDFDDDSEEEVDAPR